MWFLIIPEVNVLIATDRSPHFIYLFILGSNFSLNIPLNWLSRIYIHYSFIIIKMNFPY